jgi:hypothetical protein
MGTGDGASQLLDDLLNPPEARNPPPWVNELRKEFRDCFGQFGAQLQELNKKFDDLAQAGNNRHRHGINCSHAPK